MEPLLRVEALSKHFAPDGGGPFRRAPKPVRAVDGVTFEVGSGETLALVGETGCGKSTVARCLVRLIEPTSGQAYFDGQDLFQLGHSDFRRIRRDVQMVFQDPFASLNPRKRACELIWEAWEIYPDLLGKDDRRVRAEELLSQVGLDRRLSEQYPHQLSGGQRQRVAIARALAVRPKLIICDEPVSSLDASIQAQVLNLLGDLQAELGISYLFIAHDLAAVGQLADRVAVMYLGKIVETGTRDEVFGTPSHPYTQALISAHPDATPWARRRERIVLSGELPSPADPPSGCRFRTRCWKAEEVCARDEPALEPRPPVRHPSACHFASPDIPPGVVKPPAHRAGHRRQTGHEAYVTSETTELSLW